MFHKFIYGILFVHVKLISINANVCTSTFQNYTDKTGSPTNVITSLVKPVNSSIQLTTGGDPFGFTKITNAGNGIIIEAVGNTSQFNLTGGILCDDVYLFRQGFILIGQNASTPIGNTVDGKGSGLELCFIFINSRYGTLKNSLNYRDGVVVLSYRVNIEGDIPNLTFEYFGDILKSGQLKNPGFSAVVFSPLVYLWFSGFKFQTGYYAILGSYIDTTTNKQYSCATYLIPDPPPSWISLKQKFKYAHDKNGNPVVTNFPFSPPGNRPVYYGTGFQYNVLFGSIYAGM